MGVRVFRLDRAKIMDNLKRFAEELGRREEVLGVVLFGSLAKGEATIASDADILILLKDSNLRFDERIPYYLPSGIGIGVEVFPYTLKEIKEALREGKGSLVEIALNQGTILFEKKAWLSLLSHNTNMERE